jgi:hypothetical protein
MSVRSGVGAVVLGLLLAAALGFTADSSAKDFRPGDIRVCNAHRCLVIRDQAALDALSSFYYGDPQPVITQKPRLRVPSFELRFPNGYATGIVATSRFDRFLSYGVNEDQFVGGTWYQVPPAAALAIRRMRARLKPMRLTRSALLRSV